MVKGLSMKIARECCWIPVFHSFALKAAKNKSYAFAHWHWCSFHTQKKTRPFLFHSGIQYFCYWCCCWSLLIQSCHSNMKTIHNNVMFSVCLRICQELSNVCVLLCIFLRFQANRLGVFAYFWAHWIKRKYKYEWIHGKSITAITKPWTAFIFFLAFINHDYIYHI